MNTLRKLIQHSYAPKKFFVSVAVLVGLMQIPVLPTTLPLLSLVSDEGTKTPLSLEVAHVSADEVDTLGNGFLKQTFFGEEAQATKTQDTIEQKMAFVSSRNAYPASLRVIQKHENTIKSKARTYGVPEDVAIGIGLLENGGSDTAKSPAGALGVFQLMPGTARNLGLAVNKSVDERRNPEKNIDAGMRYLAKNYERFGDWGLSTWAYHAGEGNVSKALGIYAKSHHGITLPGIKNFAALRSYVEEHDITIHKLLSDPAVQKFTKKLNDDSSGYPYKVVATATLFKQAKSLASADAS